MSLDNPRRFDGGNTLCESDSPRKRLSRARRCCSSRARSAKKLELVCEAEAVKGTFPGSGRSGLASEERDATEVVGDALTFEAAIARARSA